MTKKIDNALADIDKAWADADKLFEKINTGDFRPEIKAEFARLQERADYLRSDAYQRRLRLSSTIFAATMGAVIIVGVNYSMASAGMSTPTKLHRALWDGLSLDAVYFVHNLWKIWRKYSGRSA